MPKLTLIYRAFDGFERAFTEQIRSFQEVRPDIDIELVAHDPETLYDLMIHQAGVLTDQFDIMLCLTDWLPQLIQMKGLASLSDWIEDHPPQDWSEGWSDSLLGLQQDGAGHVFAFPYHDGPEMFMYRSDLFQDPTEQANFLERFGYELGVPQTWSQFLDVAKFFTRPDVGLYGAIIAGKNDGHNNVYDFFIQLWSRGGRLFDERWNPIFADEIGQEALQFYVDLIQKHHVCPPKTLEYDSVASGEAYARGEGAMMWNWCGFSAVAELPPSQIIGKNRLQLIPRGDSPNGTHTSLNIYWVLGIPSGSANQALAYDFLRHCASAKMDLVTAKSGGTGVRLSTWRDSEMQAQFPHYALMETTHKEVQSPPQIPEYPQINEIFSRMQWDAVTGKKTVAQALQDASEAVSQILREAGYYA